jgi:hypothetical protein
VEESETAAVEAHSSAVVVAGADSLAAENSLPAETDMVLLEPEPGPGYEGKGQAGGQVDTRPREQKGTSPVEERMGDSFPILRKRTKWTTV